MNDIIDLTNVWTESWIRWLISAVRGMLPFWDFHHIAWWLNPCFLSIVCVVMYLLKPHLPKCHVILSWVNCSVAVVRDKIPIPLPFWVSLSLSWSSWRGRTSHWNCLAFSQRLHERIVPCQRLCRRESHTSRSSSCFVKYKFKPSTDEEALYSSVRSANPHHTLLNYFLWTFSQSLAHVI